MTSHLLDINVVIALLDPSHVHHDRAHHWFTNRSAAPWLSSPTTQHGALRILSNPAYPNHQPMPVVVRSIQSLLALEGHRFIADDVSLLDPSVAAAETMLSHSQVTDAYLIALAVKHNARLATFDRRIVTAPVLGGAEAIAQVP